MSSRTVVKCYSQTIPGDPINRREEMANMICRHKWGRDFDSTQDSLHSSGQYVYDGNRCFFLVDNGPRESEDVSLSMYKWDGKQFIELSISPQVTARLQHHPFNTSPRPGYTDDEFKDKYGEDAYKQLVVGRIRQRRRWGQKLPDGEVEFVKTYPELETGMTGVVSPVVDASSRT